MIEIIKRVCGLALITGFVLVSQTVYAQPPSQNRDPLQVYKQAGADAEQEAKIRELAHDFETQAKVRFERLKNLMKQMQEYAYEPNPDEKKVLALQDNINQLQAEMATEKIRLMLKIRYILKEEQRVKLVNIVREAAEGSTVHHAPAGK